MRITAAIALSWLAPAVAFADEPIPDDPSAVEDVTPTPAPTVTPDPDLAPSPEPAPMPPSAVTPTFTNHGGEPTDRFGNPILAPAEPAPGSRRIAIVSTGITGALVFSALATHFHGDTLLARTIDNPMRHGGPTGSAGGFDDGDKWMKLSFGLAVGAAVSAAVTGYLWTRAQPPPRHLLVHPTPEGAAVSYLGRF